MTIHCLRASYRSRILAIVALSGLLASFLGALAQGSRPVAARPARPANSAPAESSNTPALLISDIHFDPFHDPARVQELVAAPVSQWRSILSSPTSANQQQAFAALQQSCHARGVDTPFALFDSALQAMRARQPDARFMMVSGDLIAHGFDCRYAAVLPGSKPGDYQAFVLKTLSFVMGELRASFPGMPVYMALGNNDTGCGDYQLDPGSDYLAQAGRIFAEGLPLSERQQALREFEKGGYYSVAMAEPMRGTRLIVVNDLYFSPHYSTCGGQPDPAAGAAEMSWLERQLAEARRSGQRVWVMGHIPPGIDPYSTAAKFRDICGGQAPVRFLSSDKMADLLVEYADVVRLGIFAHTHMDEMRLLAPEGSQPPGASEERVAIKIIASISPVDGNNPSFTVARVNPSSAALDDYEVIAANNQTGIDAHWTAEYDYARSYHEALFSSSAVKELIGEFRADRDAKTEASKVYLRGYFVGDRSMVLSPFWAQYVCALDNYTARKYTECVCSSARE